MHSIVTGHPEWQRLEVAQREIRAEREALEAQLLKARADHDQAVLAAVNANQPAPPLVDNSAALGALDTRLAGLENAKRLFLIEEAAELELQIDAREDEILAEAQELAARLTALAWEIDELGRTSPEIVQRAQGAVQRPAHRRVGFPQVSVEALVDAARFNKSFLRDQRVAAADG